MRLVFTSRRITLLLTLSVLGLVLVHFVPTFFWLSGWQELEQQWPLLWQLIQLFNPGLDTSIPTWYSAVTLLLCSVLLATISAAKKLADERYAFHWGGLSIIFLLLSVDEVAMIHETLGDAVGSTLDTWVIGPTDTAFLHYPWIVPGAIFVLIVLLTYLRFLLNLPRKTRRLFLLSGALFVAGALGVELLESKQASEGAVMSAAEQKWFLLQIVIEEGLEMIAIVVFVYTLLSYISSYIRTLTIEFTSKD